jgi:hypothetical protein
MRFNLLKHNNLMRRSERRERLEAWAASDPSHVSTKVAGCKAEAAPNQNIENNPMQRNKRSPAWMLCPRKHFDTSGKSLALI